MYLYYFEVKKNIDIDAFRFVKTVKILCIVTSFYNVRKHLKDRQARPKHVRKCNVSNQLKIGYTGWNLNFQKHIDE
jgi:hypothetical protein